MHQDYYYYYYHYYHHHHHRNHQLLLLLLGMKTSIKPDTRLLIGSNEGYQIFIFQIQFYSSDQGKQYYYYYYYYYYHCFYHQSLIIGAC